MIGQILLIIKPKTVAHGHVGHIFSLMEETGSSLRQARGRYNMGYLRERHH